MNQRYVRVKDDIANSNGPDEDYTDNMKSYYYYLSKNVCDNQESVVAFKLFEDTTKKEIVEALVLAEADPEDIYAVFGIPQKSYQIYKELFFDMNQFLTKLDVVSYLENYNENKFGKDLKVRAYNLGPHFIYYKYGNVTPSNDQQKALMKKMFLVSAYKGAEAQFNPGTSKVSKAALDWSKNMIKAFEALEKFSDDGSNDSNNLVKVLTSRDFEKNTIYGNESDSISEDEIV